MPPKPAKATPQSSKIEVAPAAREEQAVLANLLELYAHDFSEFLDLQLGPDGRFGYRDLPLYWSRPDWHPFLIRADGQLAGLILVTRRESKASGLDAVWDVTEFFVTRRYRGRGIGMQAAHQVWGRFPGKWEVRVIQSNGPAFQFWQRAVTAFAGEALHWDFLGADGERWRLFSFESEPSFESQSVV